MHFMRHTLPEIKHRTGMNDSNHGARVDDPGLIKIIGLGQSLRGDDAAGLAAVRLWNATYQSKIERPGVVMELAELPGIGLLNLIEDARFAILVDAVHSAAKVGTVHTLTEDQLGAFTAGSGSAHGWGVAETLSIGRKLMPSAIPGRLILIGIEVGQLNLGEMLSPEVEAVLPQAAQLIEQHIRDVFSE
jgi:hydrogenase maturation protease